MPLNMPGLSHDGWPMSLGSSLESADRLRLCLRQVAKAWLLATRPAMTEYV